MRAFLAAIFLCFLGLQFAGAVSPHEILDDPVLEARARDLSAGLRCMVCQNQSIDASDAELARDLRVLVRERLTAGDTDEQVIDYIVSRYGEFVLLKPRLSAQTVLLWSTPIIVLLGGGILAFAVMRRSGLRHREAGLSPEEEAALQRLLRKRN